MQMAKSYSRCSPGGVIPLQLWTRNIARSDNWRITCDYQQGIILSSDTCKWPPDTGANGAPSRARKRKNRQLLVASFLVTHVILQSQLETLRTPVLFGGCSMFLKIPTTLEVSTTKSRPFSFIVFFVAL
jgi:hypothetical protein